MTCSHQSWCSLIYIVCSLYCGPLFKLSAALPVEIQLIYYRFCISCYEVNLLRFLVGFVLRYSRLILLRRLYSNNVVLLGLMMRHVTICTKSPKVLVKKDPTYWERRGVFFSLITYESSHLLHFELEHVYRCALSRL